MSILPDGSAPDVTPSIPAELMDIVCAGAQAHHEVSGSVAVGGTVCALYAHHRLSMDVDFVVPDLKGRFDEVREHLLNVPAWKESRVRPPLLILGSYKRVEIGYRQQIRPMPIKTQVVSTPKGPLPIPTLDEMIRIKAVLAYDRNAMRDFLDLAELAAVAGDVAALSALISIDENYASKKEPSIALEVAKALSACEPADAQKHAYSSFRFLSPRLKGWEEVKKVCQSMGKELTLQLLEPP